MTADDKINLALMFIGAMRKATTGTAAAIPGNEAFVAHALGYCDVIEAALNGDAERALAHAKDMPMRMQLARPTKG